MCKFLPEQDWISLLISDMYCDVWDNVIYLAVIITLEDI